jgi:4-hydroxybenzoyl-CoA thioesterase
MTTRVTTTNQFCKTVPVRFSACDPAGIVFYPRYLVQLNDLVEDWFNDELKIGFADFIIRRGLGFPAVKLECEFMSPSAFGSTVDWVLSLERIGTSSVTILVKGSHAGELRCKLKLVAVCTSGHQGKSCPIPEDVRAAFEVFKGDTN